MTYVGNGGEELVVEVSVCAVDLNYIEASFDGPLSCVDKRLDEPLDLLDRELLGRSVCLSKWNGARTDDVAGPAVDALIGESLLDSAANPGGNGTSLTAGMSNLDGGLGTLAVDEVDGTAQGWDLGVGPQARVFGGDAAAGLDGGGLDHDGAGAGKGELAEVDEVPVREMAVVGAVGAHGGDDEAVVQGDASGGEGLEEGRGRVRLEGRARRGVLGGRKVGDVGSAGVGDAGGHGGGGGHGGDGDGVSPSVE